MLSGMVVQKQHNLDYKLYSTQYLLLFKATRVFTEMCCSSLLVKVCALSCLILTCI